MIKIFKDITLVLLVALFPCTALLAQPGFGQSTRLNGDWLFHLGEIDSAISQHNNFPAGEKTSWEPVQLPHDWSVGLPLSPSLASATGYLPGGIGWYKKSLTVPSGDQGKQLYLYFEGVYNRNEVFINGKSLGTRPNGYISFSYDITKLVKYGQENIITVKVNHSQSADSRWYTGSGIYRDVWLVKASPVHIAQWGVYAYPELKANNGILHVQVDLTNRDAQHTAATVVSELLDPSGAVVAKKTTKTQINAGADQTLALEMNVKKPQLWSLDNPAQYILRTTVLVDGKTQSDYSEVKTGFRSFTFDPNKGFALNDVQMKVKGVCIHHDAGVLGAAMYPEVWRRRLLTLKSIGVNAIRTSHNPQASALYALCDELGLLVMNEAFDEWEFPKRKWIEGWNVGTPGFQGSFDYFEQWGERDLADMVKRDRNHLSIFAWSIGNEVDYPNDPYSHPVLSGEGPGGFTQAMFGGYKADAPDAMRLGVIAKKLAAVVRKYDNSRPVTAGLAGVAMSNETEYPSVLDIAGYNYTESRYQSDHERYPERVIYGSENRHDLAAWESVRDNEHIFGQFLWTGIDYLGESGRWPSRGFYSGLVDFAGFIKPRGYFRQSLWSDVPMAYLGSYPVNDRNKSNEPSMDAWPVWNYQEGQQIRVVCYTNATAARLELNGKIIGDKKSHDQKNGIIFWDVPYASGKLEVIGLDDRGAETTRHHIQTSGRPAAINLVSSEPITIDADAGVAQIELQIVDENGIPVVIADDEITCEVEGDVRLLGLEAGNNADMGDYTDNRQRAYHGKMIVYLQSTGKPGQQAEVQLSAPWLKSKKTKINLKVK